MQGVSDQFKQAIVESQRRADVPSLVFTSTYDEAGNSTGSYPHKPYPEWTVIVDDLLEHVAPKWVDPEDASVLVFAADCRYRIGDRVDNYPGHYLHRIDDGAA